MTTLNGKACGQVSNQQKLNFGQQAAPKSSQAVRKASFDQSNIQMMSEGEADQMVLSDLKIGRVSYPMRNLGNTCFFNAVMQCLTHTQPLLKLWESGAHTATCRKGPDCFLCLYCRYLNGIKQNKGTSPGIVVQQLRRIWPRYHLGRQEDAHEFLMLFIDSFLNSCFQTAKPARDIIWKNQEKTPIFKIFGGKLRSQVHCLGCNFRSNTYEDMSALSLDLPQMGRGGFGGGQLSVEQLLSNFCKAETLKGSNKYSCSKCGKKCEAVKRFSIEKGPRVLLIHLKRFTNMGNKIKEFIRYPKTLSLKQYSSNVCDNEGQKSRSQSQSGRMEKPQSTTVIDNETYDLYGVVVHQGSGCRSGHYYSYAKGIDSSWYSCNDEYVGKLNNGIEGALNQQAYILFYQKRITAASAAANIALQQTSDIKVPMSLTQQQKQKQANKVAETSHIDNQKISQKEGQQNNRMELSEKSTSISSQVGSDKEGASPNFLIGKKGAEMSEPITLKVKPLQIDITESQKDQIKVNKFDHQDDIKPSLFGKSNTQPIINAQKEDEIFKQPIQNQNQNQGISKESDQQNKKQQQVKHEENKPKVNDNKVKTSENNTSTINKNILIAPEPVVIKDKHPVLQTLIDKLQADEKKRQMMKKDEDILWPSTKSPQQDSKESKIEKSKQINQVQSTKQNQEHKQREDIKDKAIVQGTEKIQKDIRLPSQEKKIVSQDNKNGSDLKPKSVQLTQNIVKESKLNISNTSNTKMREQSVEVKAVNKEKSPKVTPTIFNIRSLKRDLHPIVINTNTRKRKRCALEAMSAMNQVGSLEELRNPIVKKRKLNN